MNALALLLLFSSWLDHIPARAHDRPNPLAQQVSSIAAGQHLYANECARCHGPDALGRGARPALVRPDLARLTDGDIFWLVTTGNAWHGMPAWQQMPEAQRWQIVTYLRSLNTTSSERKPAR